MENNKNSKNILFLLCLVGALLVGFFIGHYYKGLQNQNKKDKWICIYNTKNKNLYYNPNKIVHTQDGDVRVWIKLTGKDVKDNAVKFGNENGIPAEKYNNWAYDIGLWEINCKNQTARIVFYASYDTTGNNIYSDDTIHSFTPIIPGTVGEGIYRLACKRD